MILKIMSYEIKNGVSYDIADFIDKITHASVKANDDIKMPEVRCTFENGANVTISVPNVAFLMNDSGKTIEKIFNGYNNESKETLSCLHEAIDFAKDKSLED